MVFRELGGKLLIIMLMCIALKDGQPRVNAKPYQPNMCTEQLRRQTFGRPCTRAAQLKTRAKNIFKLKTIVS